MAQNLPFETSHPLVKDYLTLVRHEPIRLLFLLWLTLILCRLQVLTPLSLAANIVTVLICSIVVNPSIREFFGLRPPN